MRDKVLSAIARYSMLEPGDKVAVGLSGGADSTALLHVLAAMREEKGIDLLAIHINHGIRGEEAMRDMTFAQELCEALCVPLTCVMHDIPAEAKRRGIGLEECGRQCRYEQFALLSGERGCKIATAHTLSDSAETMIFNMTRGCGIGGMRGIPAVRGNIIRPLILCSREDIEAYCERNRLPFVTDSTNADTTYSRNRIRHDVIPSLRRINGSFLSAMERLSHSAAEDDECLRALAAERLSEAQTDGGYIAAKLAALHPALRHRAIIEAISRRTGITPERRHIELLEGCILRGSGAV
ncbi:MAG: tRNA lysidine(34) synthetase TilS, partial [Clostridia bacterium]|nr:tRNA lysidine(34) synthetase TilS [Clostridia bacterium]